MDKRKSVFIVMAAFIVLLTACSFGSQDMDGASRGYAQISQDEAKEMMEKDDGHIIVDVRRPDEFAESHIAGAINVPNEDIDDEMPEDLPDKDQILLVYCRSGNRSKEASQKLAGLGYTKVYEFGGINTWKGDIVTDH